MVGPQGGGKSALFDALLNFSMVSRGSLRQAFGPYPFSFSATRHRSANRIARIGYEIILSQTKADANALKYEIEYLQDGGGENEVRFTIPKERLTRVPGGAVIFDRDDPDKYPISRSLTLELDRSFFAAVRHAELQSVDIGADPLISYCANQISKFNRFRLDPGILGQPSRLPDAASEIAPRIGYHGEDLAATLYYLAENEAPELASIRDRMKIIDPNFLGFEFNAVGTDRIAFSAQYSDARGIVTSVRLSSGTLTYLGLITLVTTPNRPSLMMIEEPENGLTPPAVESFYEAAKNLATAENENSQIIISSHSPFVICKAWNGEDRDFIHQVKVVEGQSQIRKFGDVIKEQEIQLSKDADGKRSYLSLKLAEQVMSGCKS